MGSKGDGEPRMVGLFPPRCTSAGCGRYLLSRMVVLPLAMSIRSRRYLLRGMALLGYVAKC